MPSRFKSVKRRFLISLAGNGIRAGASFSAGVLVARGLGARSFGELAFLVAGFSSLRPLLDLGTSTAFFTFISRKGRLGPRFQLYLGWLSVQFILVLSVIVLLPPWAYGRFWFGYPRALVILAFVACFVQMQAWSTVTQIGESRRETLTMQILSASIALTHLGLVGWLVVGRLLSVPAVFYCLLGEYAVAVCVGGWLLSRHQGEAATDNLPAESFGAAARAYGSYCQPLVLSAIAGAAFGYGDCWMLQRFGGAVSQGLYQAAYQFAAISLFATTSILQVFWKELSDAFGRGDMERLKRLYARVSKGVVVAGAAVSGLLIPWSNEIVRAMLGPSFEGSGVVLALLFLYPVFQALGQVSSTLAFATGETGIFGKVTVFFTMISLMLSYLLLAPVDNAPIPGLGMGALGLAIKTVGLNIVSVNTMNWLLARRHNWRFEWTYQLLALATSLPLGFAVKWGIASVWHPAEISMHTLIGPLLLAAALFVPAQMAIIYLYPALVGSTREELRSYLRSLVRVAGGFFLHERQT
jgi:O-antigen/teichoic acid export membrane protein